MFSIRGTIRSLNRDTFNISALTSFPPYIDQKKVRSLPPSCFAVCAHHPSPTTAIGHSLCSTMYQASSYYVRLVPSPPITRPVPPRSVHMLPPQNSSPSIALYKGNPVPIPPPPIDYWHISLFFLAGPGPSFKITASALSRCSFGCANMLSSLLLSSPRVRLGALLRPLPALALVFPWFPSFLLRQSYTSHTQRRTRWTWFLPVNKTEMLYGVTRSYFVKTVHNSSFRLVMSNNN